MVRLADRANLANECWPSIKSLCSDCNLCERAVQTTLRSLSVRGFIAIKNGGGRSKSNRYTLIQNPAPETPYEKPRIRNGVSGAQKPRTTCTRILIEPSLRESTKGAGGGDNGKDHDVQDLRKPRSIEEALAKAAIVGMAPEDCRNWYRDSEACDWRRGDGSRFDNWVRQMCIERDRLAETRFRQKQAIDRNGKHDHRAERASREYPQNIKAKRL